MPQRFPPYFPDKCPPNDANIADLLVYRYCMGDVVSPNDFRSYYEEDPARWDGYVDAYALSVFIDIEEGVRGLMLPALKKKGFATIAAGYTGIDSGVIKQTPSKLICSHYSWWLYEEVFPHTWFEICYRKLV